MNNAVATPSRSWPRVKWTRAAQVAPLLGTPDDVAEVASLPPADAFAILRASDPAAATRFAAQCLSRVDAVRWLAACLADVRDAPPPRLAAAKAVRQWAANPSDEARRRAFQAGDAAGFDTIEGMACLAVFFSGGSMGPAEQQVPVNPPPGAFGQAAAAAILLAAHVEGALAFADRIARMLATADAIATGEYTA